MTEVRTTAEAYEAAALPDAHSVHADPNAPVTAELKPLPPSLSQGAHASKSPAQWAYERLVLYIQNFEEQLDGEHEVAMGIAGGNVGVMRIQGIGFFAPDIVTFYGEDMQGVRSQLVQHVNQLNVMLQAVPRPSPEIAPNRIGFRLVEALENRKLAKPQKD